MNNDEIIVDSFAGGGGASTGIEAATGRYIDVAINHDPDAILMHKTNHPFAKHYCEDVWDIDPVEACEGHPVGLLWASPDCKHFSKAKGGKPVEHGIRGLAWVVVRWAAKVRPRVIILENVEEFVTWGPIKKGKPIKSKQGVTFMAFVRQLRSLGYKVEWRDLVACDYGAATSRKRFFMVARCDGRRIEWPEATHGPRGTLLVEAGMLEPYRAVADVIDWSIPCPSIFATKAALKEQGITAVRPLADKTMRRIARGLDKFVLKSDKPFIVPIGYGEREGQAPRLHDIDAPLPTIVSSCKQYLCEASYLPINNGGAVGTDPRDPLSTITTGRQKLLATAFMTEYYGNGADGLDVEEPMRTSTTRDREGITLAYVTKYKGQDVGQMPDTPLHTITTSAGEFGVLKVSVSRDLGHWPEVRDMLNRWCGYSIADDEVLVIDVGGAPCYVSDIGLRMLTPRELYDAQGFPHDYIIDRDYTGAVYGKTKQVARCGNSVPPPFAAALVNANLPEWCASRKEAVMA